jgi:hypothetical protein
VSAGGLSSGWRLFDPDPRCGKVVRDWIGRVIAAHPCRVDADDAMLVASELFGNAVTHGPDGGQVLAGYLIWSSGVRIVVCDGGGPATPHLGTAGSLTEGGRGLLIVAAMSIQWDSFRTPGSQVVWSDLGDSLPASAADCWAWLRAVLAQRPLSIPGRPAAAAPELPQWRPARPARAADQLASFGAHEAQVRSAGKCRPTMAARGARTRQCCSYAPRPPSACTALSPGTRDHPRLSPRSVRAGAGQ